jgi:hypothetical protein
MTVTKNNGGYALAVHKPNSPKSALTCRELAKANRIDYFAPANYEKGRKLEKRVKLILDVIIAKIRFQKEQFSFRRDMEK